MNFPLDTKKLYTKRCSSMVMSEIGRLLDITHQPGFISFTAGVPDTDLYPIDAIAEAASKAVREDGKEILGYNGNCGNWALRKLLAQRCQDKFHTTGTENNVLIASGSTQCIDLCARLFIEQGEFVITEMPTYADAMDALSFSGASLLGLKGDWEGPDLEHLQYLLETNPKVKLIYVIPDFQNPTGKCWTVARRKAFMEIVAKYDVIIIEDNPYGELAFQGQTMPSLQSFDTRGQVLFLSSLSKIFSPGLRCGWVIGPTSVIQSLYALKEKCDLHTSSVDQSIAYRVLSQPDFQSHVNKLRETYGEKCQAMANALRQYLPEFSFMEAQGGFFLWAQLPKGGSGMEYVTYCIEEKVAFIPGQAFYPHKEDDTFIRLAFPALAQAEIEEGVRRMAAAYTRYKPHMSH